VSLRAARAGIVGGCDREGLADAAEDAVDLVAGCRGDAEHVEAAVDEPGPWVDGHRNGHGPEGVGVVGALVAERVVLGDSDHGYGSEVAAGAVAADGYPLRVTAEFADVRGGPLQRGGGSEPGGSLLVSPTCNRSRSPRC
jgi:hypothetical protein